MGEMRCAGTPYPLALALGVMSSPGHVAQRMAVRFSWGAEARQADILPCFLVGELVKRTPHAPWNAKGRAIDLAEPDGGPRGELLPNPARDALADEILHHSDVLILPGSAEISHGGSSGLKTLTWWRYAAVRLPNALWVGKCDDDTLLNVPRLLARMGPALQDPPPRALLGSIVWGCYSDARFKFEPASETRPCGRSDFARSRAPGEAANLSLTYEGPYRFALGWFFAMPHSLGRLLASCRYAAAFHLRAVHATHEPFLRKEDDPLNGFWLHKCLHEAGEPPVQPLPSLDRSEAHNMGCISTRGMYRGPTNTSIVVHFLKSESAMRYVSATLRAQRSGQSTLARRCCTRMVWPTERHKHPPEVCDRLLTDEEKRLEKGMDDALRVEAHRVEALAALKGAVEVLG